MSQSSTRGRRLSTSSVAKVSSSSISSLSSSSSISSSSSLSIKNSSSTLTTNLSQKILPLSDSSNLPNITKRTGSIRRSSVSKSRQREITDNDRIIINSNDTINTNSDEEQSTTTESISKGYTDSLLNRNKSHNNSTSNKSSNHSSSSSSSNTTNLSDISKSTTITTKRILSYKELQQGPSDYYHLADNEHIHSGYRVGFHTWYDAFSTLFHIHNETWNVWSHLLGGFMFISLLFHLLIEGLEPNYTIHLKETIYEVKQEIHSLIHTSNNTIVIDSDNNTNTNTISTESSSSLINNHTLIPQWPIGIFLISAIICLFSSTAFHLLHIVNKRTFELLARVDYVGIAVLICGSSVPCIIYGFYCYSNHLIFYLIMQCFFCGSAAIIGLMDKFQSPEWRFRRALIFIATGCVGIIPAFHIYLIYGTKHPELINILYGLISMGLQYIIGAMLYGFRIPERFFPGKFDFAFASHGIFHILVWTAAYTHYLTVLDYFQWRNNHSQCFNE